MVGYWVLLEYSDQGLKGRFWKYYGPSTNHTNLEIRNNKLYRENKDFLILTGLS